MLNCDVNISQIRPLENLTLDHTPLSKSLLLALGLSLLIGGCATAPEAEPPAQPGEVPDITLNLPDNQCQCEEQGNGLDGTFLDRGFEAMHAADYVEAVQNFQRYQRLEKSPQSDWEIDPPATFRSWPG